MRRKRTTHITLFLLLSALAAPVALTWWQVSQERRQQRLNARLISAVKEDDAQAVMTLLQDGADANASDHPVAPTGFWTAVLRMLRQSPRVLQFPTALDLAADLQQNRDQRHMEIVNALLEHGADINVPDHEGETVWMRALDSQNFDLVDRLLSHTPNWGLRDNSGNTALSYAVRSGNLSLVRRALDAGANIQDRFGSERDPISFAVFSVGTGAGRVQPLAMVDLLLDRGVDVNASDCNGETLLISAAELGDDELLGDLLRRGANVDLKDYTGETALDRVHDAMKDEGDPYYSLDALKKVEAMLKQARGKNLPR